MLSDNERTFKGAEKAMLVLNFAKIQVKIINGNLMLTEPPGEEDLVIQSTKQCLEKAIGGAKSTFDELLIW